MFNFLSRSHALFRQEERENEIQFAERITNILHFEIYILNL